MPIMGDTAKMNKMFSDMKEEYGYRGELNVFNAGGKVIYSDIVENIICILEHRFNEEVKLMKERRT